MAKNKLKNRIKLSHLLLSICFLLFAVLLYISLTNSQSSSSSTRLNSGCKGKYKSYIVDINNDKVIPRTITAIKCDTLTFTNQDNKVRLIAFGPHENHVSYDGITERAIGLNQSFTITLINPGTYIFHDHLNENVKGSFIVKNN